MSERTVVAVSAGLSQPSSTRMLADRLGQATSTALAGHGLTAPVQTVQLREIAHDIVNTMLTGVPTGEMRTVGDTLAGADGLIAVTPLFNTSYSGLFKSFVDVCDPEALRGLPVLLGATGGTPRHSLALDYALRPLFSYLHADIGGTGVFAATDDWAGQGDQVHPLPERIDRAGGELAAMIAARPPRQQPDPFAAAPSFEQLLGGH